MKTLKDGTATKGGVNMDQSLRNRDQLEMAFEVIIELENRVLQLESDIYDMKKQNSEMSRRVSNLESSRSVMPF